jgi:hypothetical protein
MTIIFYHFINFYSLKIYNVEALVPKPNSPSRESAAELRYFAKQIVPHRFLFESHEGLRERYQAISKKVDGSAKGPPRA